MDTTTQSGTAPHVTVVHRNQKGFKELPLEFIIPDEEQIRKEFDDEQLIALMESIKLHKLLAPILVKEIENGKYKIIDGERRFRAFKRLLQDEPGNSIWRSIPANILSASDPLAGVLANLAKVEYNPIEYAEALDAIKKATGKKQEDIAALVGKSRSLVSEYLSLLKLPDEIKNQARLDSCVPFHILKELAAKKWSEEKCIKAYQAEFERCKQEDNKQAEDSGQPKKGNAGNPIARFQKKIATIKTAFDKFSPEVAMQVEDREELVSTLDAIIKKAEALKQELDMSGQD